jgi:hypothetical protein
VPKLSALDICVLGKTAIVPQPFSASRFQKIADFAEQTFFVVGGTTAAPAAVCDGAD